jgi:hypothetical protein
VTSSRGRELLLRSLVVVVVVVVAVVGWVKAR